MILDFTKPSDEYVELFPEENLTYFIRYDGTWKGKKTLALTFNKPGVECKIVCPYKVFDGQEFDLVTKTTHQCPSTSCDTKIKGVLFDGAKSSYFGEIDIKPRAFGTKSYLENAVLVVGNALYNNVEPILKIEADDVSASHASSTSGVDESQLFYLTARGFDRDEAKDFLLEAFLAPLYLEATT